MTTPPGAPPAFIDVGNPLLAQVPARLDGGTIDIPGAGRMAVVTIRTASTTLSVVLSAEELGKWAQILSGMHASMNGAISGIVLPTAADVSRLERGNRQPQ